VKTINDRFRKRQQARNAGHGLGALRYAIAKWLCVAVLVLYGLAVLHGAWWWFVQAASHNVQFIAGVAIADHLLQESALTMGNFGNAGTGSPILP
jgi:hypothetical protein